MRREMKESLEQIHLPSLRQGYNKNRAEKYF